MHIFAPGLPHMYPEGGDSTDDLDHNHVIGAFSFILSVFIDDVCPIFSDLSLDEIFPPDKVLVVADSLLHGYVIPSNVDVVVCTE